jgi:hypothetical protein
MTKFILFSLFLLSIHLKLDEVQGVSTKVNLAKRHRFFDPNLNFLPLSKRIDNLIMILRKGNKVNEESIRHEIIDIVNSLSSLRDKKVKNIPDNPLYWYTRQG